MPYVACYMLGILILPSASRLIVVGTLLLAFQVGLLGALAIYSGAGVLFIMGAIIKLLHSKYKKDNPTVNISTNFARHSNRKIPAYGSTKPKMSDKLWVLESLFAASAHCCSSRGRALRRCSFRIAVILARRSIFEPSMTARGQTYRSPHGRNLAIPSPFAWGFWQCHHIEFRLLDSHR